MTFWSHRFWPVGLKHNALMWSRPRQWNGPHTLLWFSVGATAKRCQNWPYIWYSRLSQVHVITLSAVESSVPCNYNRQFAHLCSCWSKNNNWNVFPQVLSLQRPFTGWFPSFCNGVREFLSWPPISWEDVQMWESSICAVFCSWLSHFSRKGVRGARSYCAVSHMINWPLGHFYSLDMWTWFERWHFTELKFTIQQNSTELSLHSLTRCVKPANLNI